MRSSHYLFTPEARANMRAAVSRSNKERVRPAAERFAEKYIPEPNTGCWLWAAANTGLGYGVMSFDGRKNVRATHVSLHLAGRPLPPGLFALHRCDTPACVNPEHLFIGTKADNARDAYRKGRGARYWLGKHFSPEHVEKLRAINTGAGNGNAKLTVAQVLEIRASTAPPAVIARNYGVSPDAIRDIRTGKRWQSI